MKKLNVVYPKNIYSLVGREIYHTESNSLVLSDSVAFQYFETKRNIILVIEEPYFMHKEISRGFNITPAIKAYFSK